MTATDTAPAFTLDPTPAGRVNVLWTDAEGLPCRALATFDDADRMTLMKTGITMKGDRATVTRGPIPNPDPKRRPSYLYGDATADPWASELALIGAAIERDGLATQAKAKAAADRAERDAATMARKAQVMRDTLAPLAMLSPDATDAALAAAFDRIQDSQW